MAKQYDSDFFIFLCVTVCIVMSRKTCCEKTKQFHFIRNSRNDSGLGVCFHIFFRYRKRKTI